jgi:3-methyladenine DNA glycosylase Mpg
MSNQKTNQDYFNMNSKLYKKCKSHEEKFMMFASHLLKQFKIKIGDTTCSIEEVEVYYHSQDHKDKYTHRSSNQLKNATWYFHQFPNGSYKGGTFKGLDITFGNEKDIHAGMLIRSIMNVDTNEFFMGPCNSVNYIIKQSGTDSIIDLVGSMQNLNVLNDKNAFHLELSDTVDNEQIFTGPRVGLSHKFPEYLIKGYRYMKTPKKIPKCRTSMVSALYVSGKNANEISSVMNLPLNSVKKSITEFDDAENLDEDEVKQMNPSSKMNAIYGYYAKHL